jgi:hypothetical protein
MLSAFQRNSDFLRAVEMQAHFPAFQHFVINLVSKP